MEEVGKRTRKWRHSRLVILASPTSRRCADPMAKEKAPPPSSKPAKSGGKHTGKHVTFFTPPAHLHRRADPTAKEKAPPPSSKPGGSSKGKQAFLTPPAHLLHLPVSSLEGRSRAATEAPKYKQKEEKVNKHMVTDTPKYKQITPSVLSERLGALKEKAPPPSSELAKSGGGKQKEKVNNAVRFDQATYDKLIVTEAPKYKQMTPSVLSEQKQKEKVNTEAPKYKQITPSVLSEQKQKKESLLTKDEIANICEKVKLPEGLVSRRREPGSVCLYEEMIEQMIEQEITFPLHPFFLEILNIFKIPPGRLRGYGWFIMISFVKQCEKKNKKPSVQEFFKLYGLKTCDEFCTLYKKKGGEKTRDGRKGSHVSCDWQSRFFFFKPSSNDFPVEWGEERPRKRDVLEKKETAPDNRIKELETQLASANEKLKDLHLRLKEAEQKIVVGEGLRKELHNNIMELKGNIRVFCRVRPLLTESCGAVSYPKSGKNIGRGVELMHNAQLYPFAFDKVFDQTASQEEVFTEISQLVQSAFDGYKVCIFAYGQTGSGKTHTMMGNPEVHDQKGLIPRAMEKFFQTSQIPISQGLKYKMQASMLEIYNETIRDLLAADNSSAQDGAPSKCKIRHDANGNTDVSGLTVVDVGSMNEVSSLLKLAAQSRSVAKTQMNEESSRSHFIFRLQIVAVNQGTDQQVQGVLNLIDLAGSERLNKSGAAGDRLEETKAINKSLSSLSHVISSIAKKADHIPFRNSKLTSLLEPCLGGDSKTLMFVNLSPEASSTDESICSLRFAASVNSCEIVIPRRQTQVRSSALKESAMNAEGKDLERAMKSCDDLARENDYLRARLKDNPDLTALNNQVQALEGDKNILKTKLNKAEGEVKLLLEENRALRRSKQEAGVLAGQEENIDLKESTPPAIPASQTLQGAQEVKAAVLTSCPELA